MLRTWCDLRILTSKCASRHNGVQFFISHLARWLRTRRFSEPTFRPSGATNHWKNTVLCDFGVFYLLPVSLLWSSFFYSSLLFSSLLFSSLTLPTSAFSSVHIVGSLTSKLPSVRSRSILDRSTWGFLKWGIPKSTNLDRSILVHFTFETHGFGAWGSTILIHFRNNPHMFFFLISWILVGSLSKP